MKKFRVFSLILCLVMLCVVFAGCSNSADQNVIKIGLNYELTGDYAQYGKGCVAGIEMAIEEINAAGGIDGKLIKIVKVDNKSDNNEAMNLATRLVTKDKVVAVLGPATSGAFKATLNVADTYKIPFITCSGTAVDVTVKDGVVKPWVFRTCFRDDFRGRVMGKFAYEDLSAKKAVILYDASSDYSVGLTEAFETCFKELGGQITAKEVFSSTDSDFSPVLTKIKDKEYDVIYLPAYYETVGPIIKQARAMGIDVAFLGADGYDSATIVSLAGGAANLNDVYFTNHYSSADTSEDVVKFVSAFKAANNGAEPNAFNALGYDMGKFICDAIKRAGSTDSAAVKAALEATEGFKAVTGDFSIDDNHDPVKDTVVIRFVDGEQTFVTKTGA